MGKTFLFVGVLHLVIALFIARGGLPTPRKAVQQIAIRESLAKSAPAPRTDVRPRPSPAPPSRSASGPAAGPAAKPAAKSGEKKRASPPPPPKPKPAKALPKKRVSPPPVSSRARELIEELEKGIAKIGGEHAKVEGKKESSIPEPIAKRASRCQETSASGSQYAEALVACLSKALNLPEYGEVRIRLTLRQDGSVEELTVLEAESGKNRDYLKKHLPSLHFPPISSAQETFALTFCNEL